MTLSAPARSKLARAPSRLCSGTATRATSAAAIPIGRLISRIQRQPRVSVITPPSSVPVAPPAPFIAPHSPTARIRSGPAGNEEVMIASDAGAMIAPPSP